jgi:hypothetical protein
VVSAGLYASRVGGATLGIGELKELVDSAAGGSGFSFDDMAANLAGIRLATLLLETPAEGWTGILGRIGSESDLMPAIDDLPSGMTEAEFVARFGSLESPGYAAVIAEIERRIEALPLYRPAAPD